MPKQEKEKEIIVEHPGSRREAVVNSSKRFYHRGTTFIKRRPMVSFFLVLGLLLVLLIIGRLTQQKPPAKPKEALTKAVQVYSIGDTAKATFQAKVEKSGVVQIVAQAPGIVQKIWVGEGKNINKGQQLISLSSNYQGGNAGSVQRQIAQTQYQNVLDTFGTQNELIQKQRDVATSSAQSAQDTRDITRRSVDDTNSLIDTNQRQLDQMNQTLQTLITNNPNDPQIAVLRGNISQSQGAVNQLRAAQRTSDYQSANDKPPAQIANLQKDIALKQLDIQEKGLSLSKEVSRLQVSLAYVTEALMYPSSPFTGTVERVNVKVGQSVNPGTILATVASSNVETVAVVNVPGNIAKIISMGEPSELIIDDKKVAVTPYYVSTQATDGQLYSVFYTIPAEYQKSLTDSEYISVNVPVDKAQVSSADPFLPIDSVYQSQDNAFVLVAEKEKAHTRTIKLGKVFGSYVEVLSGIKSGDHVIQDRNVVDGDKVKIEN